MTLPTKVRLVKAMVFPVVMYGCESWTIKKAEHRRIDASELWCWWRAWESLGLQGDPTSTSYRKSVLDIHWKDWYWSWNSNTLATSCEELTHLERPWWWERLKVGEEGDNREWDGWMASPTQWTWIWVNSWSWWWTGRPGVPQSMASQSQTWLSNWTKLTGDMCLLWADTFNCHWRHFRTFFLGCCNHGSMCWYGDGTLNHHMEDKNLGGVMRCIVHFEQGLNLCFEPTNIWK